MPRKYPILIAFLALMPLATAGCSDDMSEGRPQPDASSTDAGGDTHIEGPMALGAERAERSIANDNTLIEPIDCSADCDSDGLDDYQEQRHGTEPCRADTDLDGLDDAREIEIGSDPLDEDTDRDGAHDGEEVELELDPTQRSTFADGTDDGMRWIVDACDRSSTERVHFRTHYYADWKFGLSDTFDQFEHVELNREWVADFAGAAYYGDTWTGAVGLLTASRPTSTSPEQAVEQTMVDVLHILNVFEPTYRSQISSFQTHDDHAAATQTFVFETESAWSPRDLRDRLLHQNLRYYQLDSVPTHASDTPHSRLRVGVTTTYRRVEDQPAQAHTNIIILPESTHEARRYARRQFANAIDTTNLAARESGTRMGCERFPANESPKTDFYLMLDQSRSMEGHWESVLDFATLFVDTLSASPLDYRLGVATMDRTFLGALTRDALWHTDRATFLGELADIAEDPYGAQGEFHDDDEYGLQMAREGLTYMLGLEGNQPSDSVRIRDDADVATIFVADEEPEAFQQYPLNSSSGQRLLGDYNEFFEAHSTVYALTTTDAWGYRQVALDTGGSYTAIHGSTDEARSTIEQWLMSSIAEASTYQLEQTPISSSIMVFKNGRWVPRSFDDGYAYFPQTNSLVFFGRFRPEPAEDGGRGDYVAVHYRTFSPAPK